MPQSALVYIYSPLFLSKNLRKAWNAIPGQPVYTFIFNSTYSFIKLWVRNSVKSLSCKALGCLLNSCYTYNIVWQDIVRGRRLGVKDRKQKPAEAERLTRCWFTKLLRLIFQFFLCCNQVTVMANLWTICLYVFRLLVDVSLEKYVKIRILFVFNMTGWVQYYMERWVLYRVR